VEQSELHWGIPAPPSLIQYMHDIYSSIEHVQFKAILKMNTQQLAARVRAPPLFHSIFLEDREGITNYPQYCVQD
jgi:hypothetical protein